MRWYAKPECDSQKLSVAPELWSMERADHPDQARLRPYLDNAEALLADSRVEGPWTLRLDVGRPTTRRLLDGADLDNYAYPLASRVKNPDLVSVWCTKVHADSSFVRIEPAREVPPPSTDVVVVRTTVSYEKTAFKEQIHAAVAHAPLLPASEPVKLELAFVIGGGNRNWLNLWKRTIDSLDPILGADPAGRSWHPLDGRITELGMHVTVDATLRHDVVIGIAARRGLAAADRTGDVSVGG